MTCAILIPVHEPSPGLVDLVGAVQRELQASGIAAPIWIVNDGSGVAHAAQFERLAALPGVHVLDHAVKLGKGAALKTGINAILARDRAVGSIVTADADRRYGPHDIAKLAAAAAQDDSRLYLGVRRLEEGLPWRSRFGNLVTGAVTRYMTGLWVSDTQTGLRAMPRDLCESALRIPLNGYDFEMECLVESRGMRDGRLPIQEIPVRSAEIPGARDSHFSLPLDSMRIYFVFLRYCAGSLATFVTDYLVFVVVFAQTRSIGLGIALARCVAIFVSFVLNRATVFRFRSAAAPAFARFLILVAALGWISYLATSYLARATSMSPAFAKLLVESVLFFAGFALNNVFVFSRTARDDARTDWDDYYSRPYKTASLTRRITTDLLVRLMRRYSPAGDGSLTMLELGGANSCFVAALRRALAPREYHIVDNNKTGLSLSRDRKLPGEPVFLHEIDLLNQPVPLQADITFSVGLIEHFDAAGTARMVENHFRATRRGGLVVITFPTATWLYRLIRRLAEWLKMWIFFDERPLSEEEVLAAAKAHGRLLYSRVNWAIGLTQRVMAFRCEASGEAGVVTSTSVEELRVVA